MNKKTDQLQSKVERVADIVREELRQTTERVSARVEELRRRAERYDQERRAPRRSESGLHAVRSHRG